MKGSFQTSKRVAGLPFSDLRKSLRDTMNVNMQKFADQWSTKRGIRVKTTMINFQDVLKQKEMPYGALWCDEGIY